MTSVAIHGPVAFFIGATLMALYMITGRYLVFREFILYQKRKKYFIA